MATYKTTPKGSSMALIKDSLEKYRKNYDKEMAMSAKWLGLRAILRITES